MVHEGYKNKKVLSSALKGLTVFFISGILLNMKAPKQSNSKRVRTVVYLPPGTHKMLCRAADRDSLKVSQKGAQIIIEAMRNAD